MNHKDIHEWLDSAPKHENAPVLGKREIEIMTLFWSQSSAQHSSQPSAQSSAQYSALEIVELLNQTTSDTIGLTTVQSTTERLFRKGLLMRNKNGRAFFYSSLQDKNTVISRLISEISDEMSKDDPNAMVEGFVEYFNTKHPSLLKSLQGLISECSQKLVSHYAD